MSDGVAAPRDGFAAMRVPAIRRFMLGRVAWALGRMMFDAVVGWEIYGRTDSMAALGLVGLVQVLPVLVFALPAGVYVDRRNRKDVAVATVAAHVVCALALVAIGWAQAPVWTLYVVLLAQGVITAFGFTAVSVLYTQIVPPALFVNANAWRSMSFQVAASVGPALGGFLYAWTGGALVVYVLHALAVLVFLLMLMGIERPPTPVAERRHWRDEAREGLRFVFGTELLLAAITLDMFAVLLGGATALLPVFAKDVLHVDATGLGWLRAAPSIGAFAMALVTTRLAPWKHAGKALLWTVVGFGAATIVFGLSRSFPLSFAALFFTGVFDNVSVVLRLTLEQMIVPEPLRGRVGSVHSVFISISNEMGEFESGMTAALVGPIASVVGGGIGTILVAAIVAWKWPVLRRLGRMSEVKPPG